MRPDDVCFIGFCYKFIAFIFQECSNCVVISPDLDFPFFSNESSDALNWWVCSLKLFMSGLKVLVGLASIHVEIDLFLKILFRSVEPN